MTTTVIVVVAVLAGLGIVASQLMRMREWLKKSPPLPPPDDADDPE